MARLLFGFLIVSAALVQATILPSLNPLPVTPDFVLVFLFLWSGSHGLRESLVWTFCLGILVDILALDPLGTNALALLGAPLLARLGHQRVLHANLLVSIGSIGIATVTHSLLLGVLRGDIPSIGMMLLQSLIHMFLIPAIAVVLRVVHR